jgi:serine protease AprX
LQAKSELFSFVALIFNRIHKFFGFYMWTFIMKKWHKSLHFILAFTLLLGLIGLNAIPDLDRPANLHPALAQVAVKAPEQRVSVIVQKSAVSDEAERLVSQLGGHVTKDLHIINAFAAEIPAKAVPALARASGVRWVSPDAPVLSSGRGKRGNTGNDGGTSEPPPENYFLDSLSVRQVWEMGFRGEGIGVAILDSGIDTEPDFGRDPNGNWRKNSRILVGLEFAADGDVNDSYGHGTHVAGIIGGNGANSNGLYQGVAPMVNLINLNISDPSGMAYESDTVEALQWVFDNKDRYNIRVVNLSVNSTVEQSYHVSAMNAAAEILWFNGIVVVTSVGNKGPGGSFNTVNAAPANDPFFIAVGAIDERATADRTDDTLASFSAHGPTADGFVKPDILAPGKDIISVLGGNSQWDHEHPDRLVLDGKYIRLSGTSMATPMVSGAVALLLQAEPELNPDQVKYRLINASTTVNGEAYLDVYAAVTATTTESANTGFEASQLLWTGSDPITWNSVNWNSVNWNSVNWNNVNWNSVNWNSVNWNSVDWGE